MSTTPSAFRSHRGELLDEHLAAWRAVWSASPARFEGRHYRFGDVYLEPKPWRPQGPALWFGGQRVTPFITRRLVEYGHGFHPFGRPSAAELAGLRDELARGGRDPAQIEFVGGLRPRFPDDQSPADLDEAADSIPEQLEQGYGTICFNPAQFANDISEVPALCRRLVTLSGA